MNLYSEIIAIFIVVTTVVAILVINSLQFNWLKLLLNWFPAILLAYVIPAVITHSFNLDLSAVKLHTLSKEWIIPIAIVTVMSALPFRQLRIVGIRPILVFASGSLVIAILPVLLVLFVSQLSMEARDLFYEQEYWKGLVPIVGGWIGGSTSQLVLKELIGTDETLFLSVLVLDNILVNIWTILMFQLIQRSGEINKWFGIHDEIVLIEIEDQSRYMATWRIVAVCLIFSIITNYFVTDFLTKIIVLSLIGVFIGNIIKSWNSKLVIKLGSLLILVIMSILGLKLNFNSFSLPLVLILLVIVWLFIHFVAMIVLAVLMRLNIAWVPIGSMANLGGISTAPAVTSAYNRDLMPHAILLAILSMVTGTAWGMLTIYLFELLVN